MSKQNNNDNQGLALFQGREIRRIWKDEKWYFSIVDIVGILSESDNPRRYWSDLKRKIANEGSELYDKIVQLKLASSDGKFYKTDAGDTRQILRITQSIPSKKAEPFKQWLARVGAERIEEIRDPELASKRAHALYKAKGYPEDWIEQRERGIVTRNLLTDQWKERGAKEGIDFAILTNEIYKTGFGMDAKEYKDFKEISKQDNLRDSMTNLELALTNLGEATATELHKTNDSYGMNELKQDMNEAGEVVDTARKRAEKSLGHSVVSKQNKIDLQNRRRLKE